MNSPDTILIFQKPELYFFPHYKELVFAPFRIPERSLRYLLYKLLYLLHLPCCSVFWGDWKKHLKEVRQVIIFDYGYQRGMEKYIRRVNPDCSVCLFMWNKIDRYHNNHRLFSDHDAIYSTDKGDCNRYGLHYNHMFYPSEFFTEYRPSKYPRLFFIGQDKNRGGYLKQLSDFFQSCGLKNDIRVLSKSKDVSYLTSIQPILTKQPLSYADYLKEIKDCDILLDINQDGQQGLTMRVMEAIYYSKKLITNNPDIRRYEFYQDANIFVLPADKRMPSRDALTEFLHKPFVPYPKEIINAYSFEHWKSVFHSERKEHAHE